MENDSYNIISDTKLILPSIVDSEDTYAVIKNHYEVLGTLTEKEVDTIANLAINYIRPLFSFFGHDHISIDEYDGDEGELIIDVTGGDFAILIGRHGRTLDALQIILSSYMSSQLKFHYPIIIDIEGYKLRRKTKLQAIAYAAAARAKQLHSRSSLPAMNSYERRIVHMALLNDPAVSTYSEGDEPERHVIVSYVRNR